MVAVRLAPLSAADVAAWRAQREVAGDPLPAPETGVVQEVLEVVVDEVAVGGLLLERTADGDRSRCVVRELQTTLDPGDRPRWAAVLAALEDHARAGGAEVVVTAVDLDLTVPLSDAGWRAALTMHAKRLDPGVLELQDDRRVEVRPMDDAERAAWVPDALRALRRGATRAGLSDPAAGGVEARLLALADGPVDPAELLLVGVLDGEVVGRFWGTSRPGPEGPVLLATTLDLLPGHRGRGVLGSFLGAIRRRLADLGVVEVRLHLLGHHPGLRRAFLGLGVGIHRAVMTKDLRAAVGRGPVD
ncbi:hypothetical protein [Nocardioides sp. CFH 31398]|uniref:hypothetical protein n=1 Tax=Nocardioides sp. CFH 31398 TaxID=2919579 RepID=UPI001F055F66|nr:hypothetical protein [Nocardioides sp. CFH 31398]MCH1866088.1 hypothetical protein [Nocardioides sp. CFH 31398]